MKWESKITTFSLALAIFYILIMFINHVFLMAPNIGDEGAFSPNLEFLIENGYGKAIINGMSIPFIIISYLFNLFLNNYSMSLRLSNAFFVLIFFIYLFHRKDLFQTRIKYFIFFLLLLLGTSGGIFYGTNDSVFNISICILFFEVFASMSGHQIKLFYFIFSSFLCIASRPHWIIYLFGLLLALFVYHLLKRDKNILIIKNKITIGLLLGLSLTLIINYPKYISGNFGHGQGEYLPKFLIFSYTDKTKKGGLENFNWTQWHYYSQMKGNKDRLGLFAPLVPWNEVYEYKKANGEHSLPKSYQEYITTKLGMVIRRVPFSILEVIIVSVRYIGFFVPIFLFVFVSKILNKKYDEHFLACLIVILGIITFASIWPHTLELRWLMPYFSLLILSSTSNKDNSLKWTMVLLMNMIFMDIITIWALWKWKLFYSV